MHGLGNVQLQSEGTGVLPDVAGSCRATIVAPFICTSSKVSFAEECQAC